MAQFKSLRSSCIMRKCSSSSLTRDLLNVFTFKRELIVIFVRILPEPDITTTPCK